jgi:hypothetical protein
VSVSTLSSVIPCRRPRSSLKQDGLETGRSITMHAITRKCILIAFAASFGLFFASVLSAGPFNKTMHFTFSREVGLPGVVLPAGEYVFELADTSSRNVVVVRSSRRSHVYLQAITMPTQRPANMKEGTITFGEAPAGVPKPIVAWYPVAETTGYQFIY